MPAFISVGRREHWLDIDPRSMRESNHEGMGDGTFGTDPGLEEGVTSWPAGRGYRSESSPLTSCSTRTPWRPRQLFRARELLVSAVDHKVEISLDTRPQNCEAGEWPARYIVHIRTSPLSNALPELAGLSLVCDCPVDQFSEAELLIGLYFDATSPGSSPTNRGTEGKWSRTVALLQGIQALPKGMSLPMISQEALRHSARTQRGLQSVGRLRTDP